VEYDSKLVGFVCKFCFLHSFDLGPQPDTSIRLEMIKLPCAGRVDARVVLTAFEKGADAVFVAGCPSHECLNLTGSARAEKRLDRIKVLLDAIGLGRERLMLYHVSGTNGPRLADIVREAALAVGCIGRNPLNTHRSGERSCCTNDHSGAEILARD